MKGDAMCKAISCQVLAVAITCAGLVSVAVASRIGGGVQSIERVHSPPIVKTTVQATLEDGYMPAGASSTRSWSPPSFGTNFRFGFLEFEDDADAPPR